MLLSFLEKLFCHLLFIGITDISVRMSNGGYFLVQIQNLGTFTYRDKHFAHIDWRLQYFSGVNLVLAIMFE